MLNLFRYVVISLSLWLISSYAMASDPQALIRARFAHSFPDVVISGIQPAAIPGWYLVQADGMAPIFMSADAHYMVQGDFVKFEGDQVINLSDQVMQEQAHNKLAQVPVGEEIIYSPKAKARAVVYAFTDVDCGYCRKLHGQIAAYNALGIEVRFLAWPRSGPDGMTGHRMAAVWCAEDRHAALSHATAGMPVAETAGKSCQSLIDKEYALGTQLGVDGTPTLFSAQGDRLGGYLSPKDLDHALGLNDR